MQDCCQFCKHYSRYPGDSSDPVSVGMIMQKDGYCQLHELETNDDEGCAQFDPVAEPEP
jgi:hypothetical protein